MAYIVLVKNCLCIFLSIIWCAKSVNSSRAELGTYLHIKELPTAEESADNYVLAFINYTYRTSDGREFQIAKEEARYGEGRILNVEGTLIHITSSADHHNHTGCSPDIRGTNGGSLPDPYRGIPWIALIRRGSCSFENKTKFAWLKKAAGVIIYNDKNTGNLEKMRLDDKDRNITAVFTSKSFGEEMARSVDEGNKVWISISEGQRGSRPLTNINKTSVLFVSISFIVLMIISLVWLIFYYVQRFRYLQSKDQHSRHLCTVAKRIISKIPTKTGKSEDKDNENDCCAICIEPYKSTDCIRVLPCKHEFHKNCVDPWLLEHRTCPMCKLDVLKHYGFVFIGSEESMLQLDFDMEIGESGLHHGYDDDLLSLDHPRICLTTAPSYHIHSLEDNRYVIRSSSSIESVETSERDNLPERSQSSMSYIARNVKDSAANKLIQNDKDKISVTKVTDANLLCPGESKRDNKDSISLPCTLKKFKNSEACRGSNNCYSKPTDLKHIEKGCPKSRTSYVRQKSDNELLLLADEKTEFDSKLDEEATTTFPTINIKIVSDDDNKFII